ncbi:nucleotidyl transferase/aminotransferase [Rhizobium freirei PRF 81]|uniref:Nucleotidyl transferase/aminotransferase n=1 Tax=Rhizobium freirei PRF 81 TaxID=363754 RepID=N6UV72_9HYPH|nr:NTP transferase domain-containing protein [Rhizobium freirei]ENN84651.1 nucleotidyl transferase/aminotransferase [Rhizobium freirei PRF 81]
MSIDTAIIMAAGLGSRISAFSRNAPKGFIPIAGRPIVERSIAILADRGIRHIIIGTGYMASEYEALSSRISNVQIDCVTNLDYANSGSLETFLLCTERLGCGFLSLESDLLYDAKMIDRVLECPFPNVILASGQTGSGDEVYIQTDDRSRLVNLSKDRHALSRIDAELVGICKLDQGIPAAIEAWMAREGHKRPVGFHYEEGLVGIARSLPLHVEKTELQWTEIDTLEHLSRANAVIWPRIASASGEPA